MTATVATVHQFPDVARIYDLGQVTASSDAYDAAFSPSLASTTSPPASPSLPSMTSTAQQPNRPSTPCLPNSLTTASPFANSFPPSPGTRRISSPSATSSTIPTTYFSEILRFCVL